MQALLESWGSVARMARNGDEVIDAVAASSSGIDLMLVDFRLAPPEDRFGVIARVQALSGGGIPVILVSGTRSGELYDRVSERALTMLPKPIVPARLRAAIAQELR